MPRTSTLIIALLANIAANPLDNLLPLESSGQLRLIDGDVEIVPGIRAQVTGELVLQTRNVRIGRTSPRSAASALLAHAPRPSRKQTPMSDQRMVPRASALRLMNRQDQAAGSTHHFG